MRAELGRVLQAAGLFTLPLLVVLQLFERIDLKQMLVLATLGAAIFWLGHWLRLRVS